MAQVTATHKTTTTGTGQCKFCHATIGTFTAYVHLYVADNHAHANACMDCWAQQAETLRANAELIEVTE